jgi:hypothetical protein
MAQWKKIVVSGSDISQLNNDSNYVSTAGGLVTLSGSFTGEFTGDGNGITNIEYGNLVTVPTLFSGSAQTDITQTTGYTAFSSSLATDLTALEDTTVTGGSGISTSGTLGSGVTVNVNVDDTTIEVNGSDNLQVKASSIGATQLDQVFTDNNGVAGTFGSSTQVPVLDIDEQGRITSASLSTISTTLSISGDSGTDSVSLIDGTLDFQGTNGITTTVTDDQVKFALNAGVISGSTFSSPSQGTLRTTINGVQSDIDLGLQSVDTVTFAGLNVTGDTTVDGNLTVNGTLTTLNTTNTEIKDKFILLNSGSTNPDEAGLVIDEGSGTGHALLFAGRWGVNQSISATTGSASTEAHIALVVDENNVEHDIADAEYAVNGNIKIDSAGNIYIYS